MRDVKKLIEILQNFPPDAKCYAYEGEGTGIVIKYKKKYGFVPCSEQNNGSDGPVQYIKFSSVKESD
jgi:hypothetical protein